MNPCVRIPSSARSLAVLATVALLVEACGGAGTSGSLDDPNAGSDGNGNAAQSGAPAFAAGATDAAAAPTTSCTTDADCNDGDACTADVCDVTHSGEFTTGECGHTPTNAAGCSSGGGGGGSSAMPPAVDTTCQPGCNRNAKTYPPAGSLASLVPASCSSGFELNAHGAVSGNVSQVYTIDAKTAGGSGATPLEVEFASYLVPDHIKIDGVTATRTYPLVDTCVVQTATYGDPTNGCQRPPDETIRQYKVMLEPGTKQIKVDLTGVCSPIYLRVRGLCEFDVQPFFPGCAFRLVP